MNTPDYPDANVFYDDPFTIKHPSNWKRDEEIRKQLLARFPEQYKKYANTIRTN